MAKISEIMLLQQPEQTALAVEVHTGMTGMAEAIGSSFQKIESLLKQQNEITTDIPFVEYPRFETLTEQNIHMIVGFKTATALSGKGDVRTVTLPPRKIVTCLHRGSYAELASLYKEMSEWIRSHGYIPTGTSVEYYYTGPGVPETEQVTRVEMPVQ